MVDVGANKASLLFDCRVFVCAACPWFVGVVVVVAPLREVVGEFESRRIRRRILKVNHYKLLVGVLWKEERRRSRAGCWRFWDQAEDIAVLCLFTC